MTGQDIEMVRFSLRGDNGQKKKMEKKVEEGGVLMANDENGSLSGAKKSPHCRLFFPPQTKDLIWPLKQRKAKALGKIGRLLCNQHFYN